MEVTQKELAELLGVSQMTVSRALNNHPHVEEKVRARILEVANQKGYSLEANHAAEMLRRRGRGEPATTHVICAMLHLKHDANDDESFQGRILKGVGEQAREFKWEVVIPIVTRLAIPLVVARKQVDGAVRMLHQEEADSGHIALPVPWVSVLFDVPNVDVVTVDNQAGARLVGRHLADLGHRQIAFIGPDSTISHLRLEGLRQAVRAVGGDLPDSHVCLQPYAGNEESTIDLVDSLLKKTAFSPSHKPFTALAAYNDHMAVAAMRHLRLRGIRVPEDLSLAGFDGATPRGFRGTQVTTATIPLEKMGTEATKLLELRLKEPKRPPQRLVLETELRPGETTWPLVTK